VRVKKIYNNSVVLVVDDNGAEAVMLGPGLGFSLSPGMDIDPSKVERTFVPGGATTADRLAAFLEEIPLVDIEVTQEILRSARADLGPHITDHVLVPLADHISFALHRAREGVAEIDYPLRWEVQQLYPAEVEFSTKALDLIATRTGVRLPAIEAVPLALHFVNAHLGAPDLSTALRMTNVLTDALSLIRDKMDLEIDENSTAVARLVTHLRYLFLRDQTGNQRPDEGFILSEAVRNALPKEHECALAIAELLEEKFGQPINSDEVLYLTLHIGRLTASLKPRRDLENEDSTQ
jgi:beta-glucoside operon transcriptional antiterminator